MFKVEDFTDLSQVSTEKLLKLRDVARDNFLEAKLSAEESWQRYEDILNEIKERMNVEEAL
ncbi:hypothetical protein K5Y72_003074 [Escherichia coli]|nr:hypothetical protein [Escherichia coli]EIM2934256.1 hypothetical protein [Escherichia coli]MCD4173108.1 hypothetical protein [Escherichia coli]